MSSFAQITYSDDGRTADVALFRHPRALTAYAVARDLPRSRALDFLEELDEAGWSIADPRERERRAEEARAEAVADEPEAVPIYRWTAFSSTPGNRRPHADRYDADCPDGIGLRGVSSLAEVRRLIREHGGRAGEIVDGSLPGTDREGRWRRTETEEVGR